MADGRNPDADDPASPPARRVLHVADQDVCVRFGPMLVQALQVLSAGGLRLALLAGDRELLARLEGTSVERRCLLHLGGWRAWGLDTYLHAHYSPPPDLVHLWGTTGLWGVQRWLRRVKVPLIVHALGAADVKRLMRGGLGNGQCVAVASQALAAPLLARFPMVAGRCHVIPPAIAPPLRAAPERPPQRTFSVLCVGPFGAHCGLEVLIDAVAELRRRSSPVQVALIGAGPGVSPAWRRMRERQVRECISLIDEPRLWEKVLPEMDACVVPGGQPELSIVPLLAMARGKLVVASRDQPAEWFVEDQTAWQFTPGSALELAYLLARALEQPQRAQELGQRAAAYVRTHYSVREMIEQLVALYDALLGRPGAGAASGSAEKQRGQLGTG
jgi:glycosyltransferase involved in cell wall biosynthesis